MWVSREQLNLLKTYSWAPGRQWWISLKSLCFIKVLSFNTNSNIPDTAECDPLEITVDPLRKTYLLDVDGTILIRGPAVAYPTSQLLPNVQLACDTIPNDSFFEVRPIYVLMKSKKYPVFFRPGLNDLLTMMSSDEDSKIVLATNACPIYTDRIAYLRRHGLKPQHYSRDDKTRYVQSSTYKIWIYFGRQTPSVEEGHCLHNPDSWPHHQQCAKW
mgnify:CR=1 FL=1